MLVGLVLRMESGVTLAFEARFQIHSDHEKCLR